jgi:hypothetical protein
VAEDGGAPNSHIRNCCVKASSLLLACCVRRASAADDVDDPSAESVDALTMGRMMALVAQQGGDLDVALEQVRAPWAGR